MSLASVPVGQIGDVFFTGVVLGILFSQVLVYLPHGLDGLASLEGGKAARAASLGVAVVHDRNRGGQAVDEYWVVAGVEAVVVHLVNVDRADYVEWGDQLGLHVPSEITTVDEAKIAQLEKGGHAVGVVGKILRLGRHSTGQGILGQSEVGRGLDDLLIGHHAGYLELG